MLRRSTASQLTTSSPNMKTISLAFFLLTLSSVSHISAQNTPSSRGATTTTKASPPRDVKEYLDVHNKARAEVGVRPLTWNYTIAETVRLIVRYQRHKKGCGSANLTNSKYGNNQLISGGSLGINITPQQAVEFWVEEKQYYTYANNSCRGPCDEFKQVVWKKSEELGCAQAKCVKENSALFICLYHPPGNVVGESPY